MKTSAIIKTVLFLGIVAAWGAMMILLIHKEGIIGQDSRRTDMEQLIPDASGGDSWRSIYFHDRWIGYVRTTVTRGAERNHIRSFSFLRFRLFNELRNIIITSDQELDARFRLLAFHAAVSGVMDLRLKGTRTGNQMLIDISYGATTQKKAIEVHDDFFIDQNILHLIHGKSRNVGDSYSLSIFNPLTLTTEKVIARVVAREGDRLLIQTSFGGLTSKTWIDSKGAVVREEMQNGWVLVVDTADAVRNRLVGLDGEAVDLVRELAVVTSRTLENPRAIRYLKIRAGGVNIDNFELENARQHIQDRTKGIIEITITCPGEYTGVTPPGGEGKLDRFLQPSHLIDSADVSIRKTALEIVGDEKDRWRASRRIGKWVYEHLEKTMIPDIPVATEILKHRRGDCNEHTVLFVALARAAGIPADLSAGLVYMNDGFYYHAWPKVFVGGWIYLDPTFGQDIADATHFELVSGDIAAQAKIALAMGNISIDILDAAYENKNNFCGDDDIYP